MCGLDCFRHYEQLLHEHQLPRVVVVGINPAKGAPRIKGALSRLASWMDVIGLRSWSFVNCIPNPGPYSFKDVDYDHLIRCIDGYDKVIALGGFPSKALSGRGINHHMLPHPSGLNRKLNDRSYEVEQIIMCRKYIYE